MSEEKEMAFLDHLEELRWHVVRAVASIFIMMILAFIYTEEIFKYIVFAPSPICVDERKVFDCNYFMLGIEKNARQRSP